MSLLQAQSSVLGDPGACSQLPHPTPRQQASSVNTVLVSVQARGCSQWGSEDALPEPAWGSGAGCLGEPHGGGGARGEGRLPQDLKAGGGRGAGRAAHAEAVSRTHDRGRQEPPQNGGSPSRASVPAWRCAGVQGLGWALRCVRRGELLGEGTPAPQRLRRGRGAPTCSHGYHEVMNAR